MKRNWIFNALVIVIALILVVTNDSHAATGLKMTPTEFMNKINKYASRNRLPQPIKTVTKQQQGSPGDIQSAYRAIITNYHDIEILMFTPIKSKQIERLAVISVPKSRGAADDMLIMYAALIGTLSPKLSPEQQGEVLFYLIQDLMNDGGITNGLSRTKVVNDIKYDFSYTQQTGFFLWVTNARD